MKHSATVIPAPGGVPHAAWEQLTGFQQAVLRAACRIPTGEVRTYRWIASQIGRPRAVRAVGNALSRNPFAPRVPCHRVVRSDGSLGGYAGGQRRKRALLLKEGWRPAGGSGRSQFSPPNLHAARGQVYLTLLAERPFRQGGPLGSAVPALAKDTYR